MSQRLLKMPVEIPVKWDHNWFRGWYRDVFQRLVGNVAAGEVDLRDWTGLDLRGNHDCSSIVQAAHTQGAAEALMVVAPITPANGGILLGSRVDLLTSMRGRGGSGYHTGMPRTRFIPGITDGTAALRGQSLQGANFTNFAVSAVVSGQANPHPSTGNVQNCIGLQLGKAPALIAAITKTTSTSLTIETKYLHTYETGDTLAFANIQGMGELNFGTPTTGIRYVVTGANHAAKTFTITTDDNTSWGAYSAKGIIYPDLLANRLGADSACSRGLVRDVTGENCNVNFHLSGWLNDHWNLGSFNATLGFCGGFLNTNNLDLVTEGCYQSFQLMGCNRLLIHRLEDEGDSGTQPGTMGAPSTIDYCDDVKALNYASEGTRGTATPWMEWGKISYCRDIDFSKSSAAVGGSGGVSLAVYSVNRPLMPRCAGGFTTSADTTLMQGTASFTADTMVAISFPTDQDDANYRVHLTPRGDPGGRLWVEAHAVDGFEIHCSSSATVDVDWQVVRV